MSFHTLFNGEEEKLEFYPLNNRYIIHNKTYSFESYIYIVILILLWILLFYMIYRFYKFKKGKGIQEYQSIIPNDINIEMSNK